MATQNYTVGELEEMVSSEDWHDRYEAARQGYALEKLVNDENDCVRRRVAKNAGELGREDLLDKLVDDEQYIVREAVARHGYALDRLVDDEDYWVRMAVAEQNYALDKLVNDRNTNVRKAVAKAAIKSNYKNLFDRLATETEGYAYISIIRYASEFGRTDLLDKICQK